MSEPPIGMNRWPSEKQLRDWWREEVEFGRTALGDLFFSLRDRLQNIQHERDVYRKVITDWAEMEPSPTVIREKIEAAREALNRAGEGG